jgi:hypothetical protein
MCMGDMGVPMVDILSLALCHDIWLLCHVSNLQGLAATHCHIIGALAAFGWMGIVAVVKVSCTEYCCHQ